MCAFKRLFANSIKIKELLTDEKMLPEQTIILAVFDGYPTYETFFYFYCVKL